ncbi:undecaprenyldiphospho-muramoylpentapeptide beta-N-acetylglucosaminyltransferase [Paenibacillus pini]|uniref:UDP-N-acetylglucosamine--N-acetylmuramyl-(pentapeptide) pyrophosphoryl-undecaprenol N-acetylglucosamine transferase n=1 Tax=Paenibacillus pini JCM 16418 TaxID=1236976 RepID=W7YKX6_9BACL|nr:undecaprenyldiphospho-muramoylpentapeptide beta-N-acetylglucosaminyltransferase [Paenibacillus pini]GAF08358.1 UDP-N-acetylglucosamine-N-acetylmuramyl-(pentapeptide) pyrophosphoryl-undecaprenol N-acetylglucosamine transferase [Paenibacillus pini JCM 16418]
MSATIVFTGGGTAGHVSGNLVLIPKFLEENWDVHYIGSEQGIERKLVSDHKEVTYHTISTGKLRRYFAWKNVTDVFRVMKGIFQSYQLIRNIKPNVIFSKGGFVSVPVVLGAKLNKVPIIIHEPDLNLGLANRISLPFARRMSTTFLETSQKNAPSKAIYVGPILKDGFTLADKQRGLAFCGFTYAKPVLLIMGGSLGAQGINQVVKNVLHELVNTFQVVHICGEGKVDPSLSTLEYKSYEFVKSSEMPDLLAMADVVVSRAGSNSIMELLTLLKPMLLIPHTNGGSRSGQLAHAQLFQQAGYAEMLLQEEMSDQSFINAIMKLYENRFTYRDTMKQHENGGGANKVMNLIKEVSHQDGRVQESRQV